MQPRVETTILDGALGIIPPTLGDIVAVVGASSAGPLNTPVAFARGADVQSTFGSGPLVEEWCSLIELTGKPVLGCRAAASTSATETALNDDEWTGTAVPTIDAATAADDDYEVYVEITQGGTLGADDVLYVTSLDGGRTKSAEASLTGLGLTIPTTAGLVALDFEVVGAGLIALVNELRTDMIAHFALTAGGVHGGADAASGAGIGAAATTIAEAITLANQLRVAHEAHRIVTAGSVHGAADTANAITLAAATTSAEAAALANEIKADYNAHRILTTGGVHGAVDSTNPTAAANADAGTFVAGDVLTFRTTAAVWNTTDLGAALTALKNTAQTWQILLVVGAMTSAGFSALDAFFVSLEARNIFKHGIASTRIPNLDETEAEYLTSLTGTFGSLASPWINLCAGSVKMTSAVSARQYKRPVAWIEAVRESSIDPKVDPAQVDLGPLPGVRISDENGNPDDHDETIYPGLDDARFTTLRSWDGRPGVYVNNGRMFSAVGSDFIYVQLRRVMNVAAKALVFYFENRLSSDLDLDPATGYITKPQAAELNDGGTGAMRQQLFPDDRATDATCVVSELDNVISTGTVNVEGRVIPKGYVKVFKIKIGFNNPALRTQAA